MNEAETTAEELRELIREGHSLIKDMIHERKEILRVIEEAKTLIRVAQEAPQIETEKRIREVTDEAMESITKEIVKVAKGAQEVVQSAIFDRFDLLIGIIMEGKDGQTSIPQALVGHRRPPKIDFSKITDDDILGLSAPIYRSDT